MPSDTKDAYVHNTNIFSVATEHKWVDHIRCGHHSLSVMSIQNQSVPKMRSVLCGAVVLCLLFCCTAIPLEDFVGYPFSSGTHQVFHIPPSTSAFYDFPVNISQPFVIDGRGLPGLIVSHHFPAVTLAS